MKYAALRTKNINKRVIHTTHCQLAVFFFFFFFFKENHSLEGTNPFFEQFYF